MNESLKITCKQHMCRLITLHSKLFKMEKKKKKLAPVTTTLFTLYMLPPSLTESTIS